MPAGGEAHDADAVRLDVELGRARSHDADRAEHVLQHRRMVVARAQAVLQDERRDAARREPARHLMALVVHRERAVAAARADHDARAGGLGLRRQVDRERGDVGVRRCPVRPVRRRARAAPSSASRPAPSSPARRSRTPAAIRNDAHQHQTRLPLTIPTFLQYGAASAAPVMAKAELKLGPTHPWTHGPMDHDPQPCLPRVPHPRRDAVDGHEERVAQSLVAAGLRGAGGAAPPARG